MRNRPEYSNENRDFNRYLTYMHEQVRELCSNYGKIDILWFDFSYGNLRGEAWKATELMKMVRSLQPDVIIDNRLECSGEGFGSLYECNPTPYHGDFVSPEQIIPPEGIRDVQGNPLAWEACFTMNNHWGYCGTGRGVQACPHAYQKAGGVRFQGRQYAAECGSGRKGQHSSGVPAHLAEIGRWMKKNSASVYGCGMAGMDKPDCGRITRKGNLLYYHVFENSIGPLPLPGLKPDR